MTPISLISNVALNDPATNDDTSTVAEPSVAAANGQIFATGNWFASRSTNNGGTWTYVDPFAVPPVTAGSGLNCCDALVLHDRRRGLWIWIKQYVAQNGTNIFRLVATHDADFASGAWYWWDIAPMTLDPTWTQVWFDYPDAALTSRNLVVTFNVFDANDNWQRAVVMRFPLDQIDQATALGFQWWSTTANGSLRLTQGAGRTVYWASHNSTQQLRLFAWRDGQNMITWWDVGVGAWSDVIASVAPNGVDWLGRADERITAASVGGGVITFMWTAGSRQNRPHAYCRVVRIREATKQVIDEPDVYSNQRAWAYPAAATNDDGIIGFTAFYGGADRHPGHVVGVRDDPAGTWTTVYTRVGSHSPDPGRWGDYLSCRRHSSEPATWMASGYTLEGGQNRRDILPRVVHFTFT
jgi:hypothetical protein